MFYLLTKNMDRKCGKINKKQRKYEPPLFVKHHQALFCTTRKKTAIL